MHWCSQIEALGVYRNIFDTEHIWWLKDFIKCCDNAVYCNEKCQRLDKERCATTLHHLLPFYPSNIIWETKAKNSYRQRNTLLGDTKGYTI